MACRSRGMTPSQTCLNPQVFLEITQVKTAAPLSFEHILTDNIIATRSPNRAGPINGFLGILLSGYSESPSSESCRRRY